MDEKCENCKKLEDKFKVLEKKYEDMCCHVLSLLQETCGVESTLQTSREELQEKFPEEFEDLY